MGEEDYNWWRGFKKFSSIIWLLLILIGFEGSFQLVEGEGNVGCHFIKSLCFENVEFCYDDLIFGKCLSKSGVEQEDLERKPLTKQQSEIMATMLEEMQGAGLGWDHPYVQCRIQGTLFSFRRNTVLPPNLCANLAPDPELTGPQSPMAVVRFTPPDENRYADEVYYPPFKKGFDERFKFPPAPSQLVRPLTPENYEVISEFSKPDLMDRERKRAEEDLLNHQLLNRMKDIRNRIELRRLLNEENNEKIINRPESDEGYFNEILPENFIYEQEKRGNGYNMGTVKQSEEDGENSIIPSTFFREIAQTQHIPFNPSNPDKEIFNLYKSNPLEALISDEPRISGFPYDYDLDNEEQYITSNIFPAKYSNNRNKFTPESSGVYAEGGLVFVPEGNDKSLIDQKDERRSLLENMLGFRRHERLDVKKPGPLVGPPAHEVLDKTGKVSTVKPSEVKVQSEVKIETKEILPVHIKDGDQTKAKKLVYDHSDEEHAPHTVDTEYVHVIIKNP